MREFTHFARLLFRAVVLLLLLLLLLRLFFFLWCARRVNDIRRERIPNGSPRASHFFARSPARYSRAPSRGFAPVHAHPEKQLRIRLVCFHCEGMPVEDVRLVRNRILRQRIRIECERKENRCDKLIQ